MTYIEFFDKTATENICACLSYAPEQVIFIGSDSKLMRKHIANYQRVFADRNEFFRFEIKTVPRNNLDDAVQLLSEIVESYDDCVFDITGGEEILNLALGIVYARYPEKHIQIHKFNLRNNTIADCDKDGVTIYREPPMLSVEENIRVYGGDVLYGGISDIKTYRWELSEEFTQDVYRMWEICRENPRFWNVQINMFEAIENMGTQTDDGLTTVAQWPALDQHLAQRNHQYRKNEKIIDDLLRHGLLTWYWDESDDHVTISYKNAQVKKCLTKAGLILEMKVYLTARQLRDEKGRPIYNDSLNGVVIDWDGTGDNETPAGRFDTSNEIDVLLMHGTVPVFISCKNGMVNSEELYKLSAVADRFGGPYAKKVLVASALDQLGPAADHLRQRAADMQIRIIEDLSQMDEGKLEKTLKNLWSV